MSLPARIRNLFRRSRVDSEIEMELAAHIAMRVDDNLADGMSHEQARREALLRFGNRVVIKERVASVDTALLLESVCSDLQYGLRQLRKYPGFAFTAIVVLAIGICSSVSIFAFFDATLVRPLPYREPSRLMGLFESNPLGSRFHLSYLDYLDWKRMNHVFSSVEAYDNSLVALKTESGVQRADGAVIGAGLLRMLGVTPMLGRDFRPGEDSLNAPRVAMLSYQAWQNRYGGRPDILGKTITLDGVVTTIVGVLPRDFYFGPVGAAEFWTPIHASLNPELRGEHDILAVARLRDGVSFENAAADIHTIAERLAVQYPDDDGGRGGVVVPLVEMTVGAIRPTLWLLLSAALLLLLIACFNVSGLLLLRLQTRQQEISVRSALGASRLRLVRQLALEAGVLTASAGLVGICAASGAIRLLRTLVPLNLRAAMPYLQALDLNRHVLGFALVVMLATTAMFALIGAVRAPFMHLRRGLTESHRTAAGTVWRRLGANLVVVELCTTTVLLIGAGLLSRSFYQLIHTATGIRPDHLATLRLWAPPSRYTKDEQFLELGRRLMEGVRILPGVRSVAVAHQLPIANVAGGSTTFEIPGTPGKRTDQEANGREVSTTYFSTLGARLLSGRWFADSDDAAHPRVAIINRTFAEKFFASGDALGKHLRYDASQPLIEIVGVVDDLKEGSLDAEPHPTIYTPFNQSPQPTFYVVARTEQAPQALLESLRQTVRRIDPEVLTAGAETMEDRLHNLQSTYLHRSSAWLSTGFALVALLLSVVGLYGVVAYSVSQRTREIGVRMALGASRESVYRLVLSEAGRLVGVGVALGLATALGTGVLMRKLLFATQPWDGPTFAAMTLLLACFAALACLLPARRAATLQPMDALRSE